MAFQRAKEAGINVIPIARAGHLWSIEMSERFVQTNLDLLLNQEDNRYEKKKKSKL